MSAPLKCCARVSEAIARMSTSGGGREYRRAWQEDEEEKEKEEREK